MFSSARPSVTHSLSQSLPPITSAGNAVGGWIEDVNIEITIKSETNRTNENKTIRETFTTIMLLIANTRNSHISLLHPQIPPTQHIFMHSVYMALLEASTRNERRANLVKLYKDSFVGAPNNTFLCQWKYCVLRPHLLTSSGSQSTHRRGRRTVTGKLMIVYFHGRRRRT